MKTNRSINLILGVALVVLIIAALLLPPISLPQRLSTAGMKTIAATTDSDVSDPDGTRVAFPAYGVPASFRAKLTSTPRAIPERCQRRSNRGRGQRPGRPAAEPAQPAVYH